MSFNLSLIDITDECSLEVKILVSNGVVGSGHLVSVSTPKIKTHFSVGFNVLYKCCVKSRGIKNTFDLQLSFKTCAVLGKYISRSTGVIESLVTVIV